ncbi:hypothetical protein LIA77_02692 [Sarocladium implicatum]|nr:hypothetical protein LIA77_02692 [Sarocladium implicatum]
MMFHQHSCTSAPTLRVFSTTASSYPLPKGRSRTRDRPHPRQLKVEHPRPAFEGYPLFTENAIGQMGALGHISFDEKRTSNLARCWEKKPATPPRSSETPHQKGDKRWTVAARSAFLLDQLEVGRGCSGQAVLGLVQACHTHCAPRRVKRSDLLPVLCPGCPVAHSQTGLFYETSIDTMNAHARCRGFWAFRHRSQQRRS